MLNSGKFSAAPWEREFFTYHKCHALTNKIKGSTLNLISIRFL